MNLVRDGEDGFKALRMGIRVPETTDEAAIPLFKLEEGVASSSAGLVCAKMAGVKDAVVERAEEIVRAVKERRKVEPLVEILRDNVNLSDLQKETVYEFLATEWEDATNEEVDQFLSKVYSCGF
jgi:DNA mismatch repair protein MSH5